MKPGHLLYALTNIHKLIKVKSFYLPIILLIVFCSLYSSDSLILGKPEKMLNKAERMIATQLKEAGLHAYWTFDEPFIQDEISGYKAKNLNTTRVSSALGSARKFKGYPEPVIQTPASWRSLNDSYTISIWIKADQSENTQAILYWLGGTQRTGLILHEGNLTFNVPSHKELQVVQYPFTAYGEFVHIAAVVDASQKRAYLYENGELKDQCTFTEIDQPSRNMIFGKMRDVGEHNPYSGEIDDAAIFKRALTSNEIERLAKNNESILDLYGGKYVTQKNLSLSIKNKMSKLIWFVEKLNPFTRGILNLNNNRLPAIEMQLSLDDQKFFRQSWTKYLKSDVWNDDILAARSVMAVVNGKRCKAELSLFRTDEFPVYDHRKTFLLKLPEDVSFMGEDVLILSPLENHGWLSPLWEYTLHNYFFPKASKSYSLIQLYSNHALQGIYFAESFKGHIDRKKRKIEVLYYLNYNQETSAPLLKRLSEFYDDIGDLLVSDPANGINSKRVKMELKQSYSSLESKIKRVNPERRSKSIGILKYLSVEQILGENLSPYQISTDLNLSVPEYISPHIQWESGDASLLSHEGTLVSQVVTNTRCNFTVTINCEGESFSETYDLLLIPKTEIPVIYIQTLNSANNNMRVASSVSAAGLALPRAINHAGLKYRGNYVLRNPKKSYSVRFDEPHGLFGKTGSTHMYLMAMWMDRSFLRNKLCFDFLRGDEGLRDPKVLFVELVKDGDYMGLYQIVEKIDRHSLGWEPYKKTKKNPNILYYPEEKNPSFYTEDLAEDMDVYGVRWPDELRFSNKKPLYDFLNFIGSSSTEEFIKELPFKTNIRRLIDYHLLLWFSDDHDGVIQNIYFAKQAGKSGTIDLIPWDKDSAFRDEGSNQTVLYNYLLRRLVNENLAYYKSFAKEWERIRSDELVYEQVENFINMHQQKYSDAAERSAIQWGYGVEEFHQEIQFLKEWIQKRLSYLDRYIRNRERILSRQQDAQKWLEKFADSYELEAR